MAEFALQDANGTTVFRGTQRGGMQDVTVVVTVAQQLAMNTSPPLLLAGVPGVILVPCFVFAHTSGGVGGYTLAGSINVTSGQPAGIGVLWWPLPTLTLAIQQGPDFFSNDAIVGQVGGTAAPNTLTGGGLYLYADTADPTLGDTDLTVRVLYFPHPV